MGGFCPGGILSGGYCPGGYCPGGYCPRTVIMLTWPSSGQNVHHFSKSVCRDEKEEGNACTSGHRNVVSFYKQSLAIPRCI